MKALRSPPHSPASAIVSEHHRAAPLLESKSLDERMFELERTLHSAATAQRNSAVLERANPLYWAQQSLHSPIARALRASESLKALPAPAQPSPSQRRPTMPRPLHPSQSEALLQRPLNFRAQDMPTRHRSQPTALEIALIASAGVRAEARHSVQEQVQLLEKLVGIDRPSVRALLVLSNKAITSLQTSTEALEAEALSMYYALSSAFEQQRRVADDAMQELKRRQMQYEDALSTVRFFVLPHL